MASFALLTFLTLCASSALADINVADYLYWKRKDIEMMHTFYPMRCIEEERQTIERALSFVQVLSGTNQLYDSLKTLVQVPLREYMTAELLMNGTEAQGCVLGLSDFIPKAIQKAIDTYNDYADGALSKLIRSNNSLTAINSTLNDAFVKVKNGITMCNKTYPDSGSKQRLMSCVNAMTVNYENVANSTCSAMYPSPSMKYITDTVIVALEAAARSITDDATHLLDLLVACAKLDGDMYMEEFEQEVCSEWKGYNETLKQQINTSQSKNYDQVNGVEKLMGDCYAMQKAAQAQYIVNNRPIEYFRDIGYSLLANYYNSMTVAGLDNPGDMDCVTQAKGQLDSAVSTSALANLACDMEVVNSTISIISEIYNIFLHLNDILPSIGNVAILKCLTQGYPFAPNTIQECFELGYTEFALDYSDYSAAIRQKMEKLNDYRNIYNEGGLPCGGTTVQRLLLEGEKVLHYLERSLYITSGTTYPVTTPPTYTITTGSSSPSITTTTPYY